MQHIIHIMHKRIYWSLEFRRPDSIWAKWVPNTFLFRNLASELSFFWIGRLMLCLYFYFWVDCNQDKKLCNFWQIVTRIQSLVIFNLSSLYFFTQLMIMKHFGHLKLYLIFSFFLCIKKISGDSTPLIQKERCPGKVPKSLFLEHLSFAVSHTHYRGVWFVSTKTRD